MLSINTLFTTSQVMKETRCWLAMISLLLLAPVLCDRGRGSTFSGIVDFGLEGNFELGFYTVTVELGFPPRPFKLVIDTGSDLSWIACASEKISDTTSAYDPRLSSTAVQIGCTDEQCSLGDYTSCGLGGACSFDMTYVDGSFSSGYYVMDWLHLQVMALGYSKFNVTSPFLFGCATNAAKEMSRFLGSADGILGLGRADISVISQLADRRVAPRALYHCLNGSGGGVLALGAPVHPDMVYTPLIPGTLHYNVHLRSIRVDGQPVHIHSGHRETYFDSGTKLAQLAEQVYLPLLTAVTSAVSGYAHPVSLLEGSQCYSTSLSVGIGVFPHIRLDFEGGASLPLAPEDYVIPQIPGEGSAHWCLGFQPSSARGITILGELVMRNRLVVYDLTAQRVGWAYYSCSDPVPVSSNYTSSAVAAPPRIWVAVVFVFSSIVLAI